MDLPNLLSALKRALKARGLTYRNVATLLDVSEPTVKRLLSSGHRDTQGGLSVERLLRLCEAIGLELSDLARAAGEHSAHLQTLTPVQERALLRKPRLLAFFYLLLNGWESAAIKTHYEINAAESQQLLTQLDRLGLIELHANNRIRLKVARQLQWSPGGLMSRAFGMRALHEFIGESEFQGTGEMLRYQAREISPNTHEIMMRKFAACIAEFHELADQDLALPPAARRSVGFQVALRPFVFSAFGAIKRRAKPLQAQRR